MPCFYPIKAHRPEGGGKLLFGHNPDLSIGEVTIPCGRCIGCRLMRTQSWATRIMHEASLHESNYFVTFTYKDMPQYGSLNHEHFQLFMKRLRERFCVWDVTIANWVPRFFMCGEYGEEFDRPHYHAAIFGLVLPDLVLYSESNGHRLYTSKLLDDLWKLGECKIGSLTFDSAAYIAAYCVKKVTGDDADSHYQKLSLETGEIYSVAPEYARMSLRPGIGAPWFDQWSGDLYPNDFALVNGKKRKLPRYYDDRYYKLNITEFESLQMQRLDRALEHSEDNSFSRLRARELVAEAAFSLKMRTLK